MTAVTLNAYAKLNLTLDILKRLASGYHEIKTVYHQIQLHDTVTLRTLNEKSIIVKMNKKIPVKSNLAYKAAMLLKKRYNVQKGAEIAIEKNIPLAAGLSGGSTDAAAVLAGLNKVWNLKLGNHELMGLAKELGMDVPFSLTGNTAIGSGRGEEVEKMRTNLKIPFLLINPGFEISTKEAYEALDQNELGKNHHAQKMIDAFRKGSMEEVAQCIGNDFEPWAMEKYPEIGKIKQELLKAGALNAGMTGSGPTVFGIFETEEKAQHAHKLLKDKYPFVQVTRSR